MHTLRTVLLVLAGALLLFAGRSQAQNSGESPADLYFRGYIMKGDAERLEQGGDAAGALAKFRQSMEIFDSIAKNHPNWEQIAMLAYRQQRTKEAIVRLEAKLAATPASTTPAAGTLIPIPRAGSATPSAGGAMAQPAELPSISSLLNQYESAYKQRIDQLGAQNKQYESDLLKWQQWHQWQQREMQASKETMNVLAQRAAAQEQQIAAMQKDVETGRAAQGQLDALKKNYADTAAQLVKAQQSFAAAETAAKESSEKLAAATAQLAKLQQDSQKVTQERDLAAKHRDAAMKQADSLGKERDTLAAQNLGIKTELDDLKKVMGGSDKELLAKNQALKKELDDARVQIAKLKGDLTQRDAEVAQLRGQLTTIQGELATLRQQNAAYQTQVAELTTQLKDVQARMQSAESSPQLVAENQLLRGIILRQLRAQARQQQAKTLIIAELKKTENASQDLLQQVESLSTARVSLTAEEEKLFTEPQLKEALKETGFQATLMASSTSGKADAAASPANSKAKAAEAPKTPSLPPAAAASPVAALFDKANAALQAEQHAEAAKLYEDVLRAEPKNASALVGLGAARLRSAKFADAEVSLKKALACDASNEAAHFYLGTVCFKQNRDKEAMASFEKCVAIRPQNARANHYLGILATRMGLLDRAEREFKTAIAVDPAYGDAYFNLAVLYVTWDPPKLDLARSNYDLALKKGVKPDAALEKILGPAAAAKAGAAVSAR